MKQIYFAVKSANIYYMLHTGGAKGAQCPGLRITGGAENSQQCHKYFLQCSTFASEKP